MIKYKVIKEHYRETFENKLNSASQKGYVLDTYQFFKADSLNSREIYTAILSKKLEDSFVEYTIDAETSPEKGIADKLREAVTITLD